MKILVDPVCARFYLTWCVSGDSTHFFKNAPRKSLNDFVGRQRSQLRDDVGRHRAIQHRSFLEASNNFHVFDSRTAFITEVS